MTYQTHTSVDNFPTRSRFAGSSTPLCLARKSILVTVVYQTDEMHTACSTHKQKGCPMEESDLLVIAQSSTYPRAVPCSLSADTSSIVTTTSNTERSDLLEACQTAWYNGTTAAIPELNPDGTFSDITCVTAAGNVSYQDALCQNGYNGLLCTNCNNGWGNSRTFHCNECMSSVPTNTFLIFLGHLASFCYVAWLVRGSLASAAHVGRAEADHCEQFSDMMKVASFHCYLTVWGVVPGCVQSPHHACAPLCTCSPSLSLNCPLHV